LKRKRQHLLRSLKPLKQQLHLKKAKTVQEFKSPSHRWRKRRHPHPNQLQMLSLPQSISQLKPPLQSQVSCPRRKLPLQMMTRLKGVVLTRVMVSKKMVLSQLTTRRSRKFLAPLILTKRYLQMRNQNKC